MRRSSATYRFTALLVGLLLFFSGCATVPRSIRMSWEDQQAVRKRWHAVVAAWQQCVSCVDARATVTLKSFGQTGTVEGYLQAKAPSFLKFVGLNPLGQPLFFLTTDGLFFRYVSVPEARSFEGSTRAAAFVKFAPEGFDPRESFSWFAGRPPGAATVSEIRADKGGAGYWLVLQGEGKNVRRTVLFDAEAGVIRRQLLCDRKGEVLMEVRYQDYLEIAAWKTDGGSCKTPGKILVMSQKHNSIAMTMALSDWLADPDLTADDFIIPVPPGFEKVKVE